MKIDILICTYNEGIVRAVNILMPYHPDVKYKISHQVTKEEYRFIPEEFEERADVRISQISSAGLSKNRNNALAMAEGDICFIADDDVKYDMDIVLKVAGYFKTVSELDVFVGRIKTYDGEPAYKKYKVWQSKLGWKDIGGVSSIEMVLKREVIRKNHIRFDDHFGIGGNLFPKGEEAVFLSDCLRNKLHIVYFPEFIVKHSCQSSCSHIVYSEEEAKYMGALNRRIFKWLAYPNGILFGIKHFKRYKKNMTFMEFIQAYYKGIQMVKYQ